MATPRQAHLQRVHAKARRKFYNPRGGTRNMNMTRGASYTDFPRNTAHKPGTEDKVEVYS